MAANSDAPESERALVDLDKDDQATTTTTRSVRAIVAKPKRALCYAMDDIFAMLNVKVH